MQKGSARGYLGRLGITRLSGSWRTLIKDQLCSHDRENVPSFGVPTGYPDLLLPALFILGTSPLNFINRITSTRLCSKLGILTTTSFSYAGISSLCRFSAHGRRAMVRKAHHDEGITQLRTSSIALQQGVGAMTAMGAQQSRGTQDGFSDTQHPFALSSVGNTYGGHRRSFRGGGAVDPEKAKQIGRGASCCRQHGPSWTQYLGTVDAINRVSEQHCMLDEHFA